MVGADMHSAAHQAVQAPAIALIVAPALSLVVLVPAFVFSGWLLLSGVSEALPQPRAMTKETQIAIRMLLEAVMMVLHIITIVGALKMRRLRGYSLAKLGATFACIPCLAPCLLLGIPFGIWAISVLNKPFVREAFVD